MKRLVTSLLIAAMLFLLPSLQPAAVARPAADALTGDQIRAIAVEAYVYLYPLITMDVTRKQLTNVEAGKEPGRGPMGEFSHMRAFPTADLRVVVRPNFDTLYSIAWLDLTKEPSIVSAPDTAGRYYLLPMLDMWSDVFAVPGSRTSGTGPGAWAVVPHGWTGKLPDGLARIDAPTPYVWVIGRTQTNGEKDYDAVHKIQDGFKVTPLSAWGKSAPPIKATIDPSVDMKTPPLDLVNGMPAAKYFTYGAELMKLHPPHVTDWSTISRMKRLGIEPGKSLDWNALDPAIRSALEQAPAAALRQMKERGPTMARAVHGWQMNTDTMGVYGNYYLKRALVAMLGLGANQPEDAIYPMNLGDSSGNPVVGEKKYVMHFEKVELPPVDAFWSITMYDEQGFQAANPINRFAIGDRDALKYNPDGSLDIYIQNENPGKDKESNWLPAPKGILGITMRLYAPKPSVLQGLWAPPAIKEVK